MDSPRSKQSTPLLGRLLVGNEASSAIEYATLLGLITVTLLPVVQVVGKSVMGIHESVAASMAGNAGSVGSKPTPETPPPPPPPDSGYDPAPEEPSSQ
jgi:Flp pilus assembly pilin Flp